MRELRTGSKRKIPEWKPRAESQRKAPDRDEWGVEGGRQTKPSINWRPDAPDRFKWHWQQLCSTASPDLPTPPRRTAPSPCYSTFRPKEEIEKCEAVQRPVVVASARASSKHRGPSNRMAAAPLSRPLPLHRPQTIVHTPSSLLVLKVTSTCKKQWLTTLTTTTHKGSYLGQGGW